MEKVFDGDPGTRWEFKLKFLEIQRFNKLYIPGQTLRGSEDGPTVLFIAGIHGDELNGVEVVRRLSTLIDPKSLRGTLVLLPSVNILGILNQERYMLDGRDLNRKFPGLKKGSFASRVAKIVFRIVEECDAVVDFHSATGGRKNAPQIRADLEYDKIEELAYAFGLPLIFDNQPTKGTLRRAAADAGVPCLLYEGGGAGAFEERPVRAGVQGAKAMLAHIDMLDIPHRDPPFQVVLEDSSWLRANRGGLLTVHQKPGAVLAEGERIATLKSIYSDEGEEILAPEEGILIGVTQLPIAVPGAPVAHILEMEELDEEDAARVRRMGRI